MILHKLRLNNFRCYAGTIDLQFATDSIRNTTIVLGTNGAGKTSILQALQFALYGLVGVTTDSPLINNDVLKDGREHEPARASVILEYSDRGIRYSLTRSLRGFLLGDKVHYLKSNDDLSLTFTTPDGQFERDPFPQSSIEQMLPFAIRTFFVFDGDRIADFTRPGRERDEKIGEAVNDVLHIRALSKAVEHTYQIANDKRRAMDRLGAPAVAKTNSEINVMEAAILNKRRRVDETGASLLAAEERMATIDGEITSFIEVAELARKRRELEGQRQALLERGQQLQRELSRATVRAVSVLADSKVVRTTGLLENHKAKHEIPARIADYFIKQMLNDGKCICGRSLDDGSSARAELNALLATLLPNSLQDIATELSTRLRSIREDSARRQNAVIHILQRISETGSALDRVDHELEKIGQDIDATALDRIKALNGERGKLSSQIRMLAEQRSMAQREFEAAQLSKSKLEDKLKAELAKQQGHNEMHRGWLVAKDCHEVLQRAKTILEERLRDSLSAEGTAILKNLVSDAKKYFFAEVKVDKGFVLRVLDSEGRNIRAQLSMGETQVSSLAFMLAMTRLGGQEAPLIVDTPLARLDDSVRVNTASWLPELTPQLILLVTDAEYSAEVQARLAPRIGRAMRLIPSKGGTRPQETVNA